MNPPRAPLPPILSSYEEVLAYLDGFTNYERQTDFKVGPETLGLGRIHYLLQRLGAPQAHFDSIHIAGTKGKGSTSVLTAALLSAAGLRVGLYTSPHLVSVRERIVIDGAPIGRERFVECFTLLRPVVEELASHAEFRPATYFEVLTALAFLAFAQAHVDVAVLETGLGGRFDATNVVQPVVTAITPISLDHTRQLGDTVEQIAMEKAGIMKDGVPVVLGPQPETVATLLREAAATKRASVRAVGSPALRITKLDPAPPGFDRHDVIEINTWKGNYHDIPQPLIGRHQTDNALVAAGVAETYLESTGRKPLTAGILRRAWRQVELPGRIEVIDRTPWTILDGAHNVASVWALSETVRERSEANRTVLVFAAARDKDIAGMLKLLAPMADEILFTDTGHARSCPVEQLEAILREIHPGAKTVSTERNVATALETARRSAGPEGLVLITGSLYLVGRVREKLYPHLER